MQRELLLLLLNVQNFLESSCVPFVVGELRRQKCARNLQRWCNADHAGAEAKNIHIVVFNTLVTRVGIMREAGTNTFDLVCRNARPNAAAAYQDSSLNLPRCDSFAKLARKIRIVGRRFIIRAEVNDFMAIVSQFLSEIALQRESCMVTCKRNLHPSTFFAAATTAPGVMPNPLKTTSTGADIPKVDIPTKAPAVPM